MLQYIPGIPEQCIEQIKSIHIIYKPVFMTKRGRLKISFVAAPGILRVQVCQKSIPALVLLSGKEATSKQNGFAAFVLCRQKGMPEYNQYSTSSTSKEHKKHWI